MNILSFIMFIYEYHFLAIHFQMRIIVLYWNLNYIRCWYKPVKIILRWWYNKDKSGTWTVIIMNWYTKFHGWVITWKWFYKSIHSYNYSARGSLFRGVDSYCMTVCMSGLLISYWLFLFCARQSELRYPDR